jgi:hypothetical protein
MPSGNPIPEPGPLYSMPNLKRFRDILLGAKSFPTGSECNRHRQVALPLRRLFKNQKWLDVHTVDG